MKEFALMPMIILIKLRNLIVFIVTIIITILIKRHTSAIQSGKLLLIRMDEIGDYILFRNFIEILRKNEKYQNCKIYLCGNLVWKELAEKVDSQFIDQFIWINKKQFVQNWKYRYKVLNEVYQNGFEIVINSSFSRGILYDDSIVKASKASIRIGSQGSREKHASWKRHLLTDTYYTRLIPQPEFNLFEFYRNKYFFEEVLRVSINLKKPFLSIPALALHLNLPKNYCVLFPGAGEKKRMWDIANFSEVTKYIIDNFAMAVVVCGSSKEIDTGHRLQEIVNSDLLYNLIGKTSLYELGQIIGISKLLISNETGAVHMAVAVNTPVICVSNGKYYGRFNPYPGEIFNQIHYIYPPEIKVTNGSDKHVIDSYGLDSNLNINTIHSRQVIELTRRILSSIK